MEIKNASFVKSFKDINGYDLEGLPEIAVIGRSNVGKSSLINYLTNNYKLAKTSGIPGKTRLINYFLINNSFYLVDLPGYGYAKASKSEQETWQPMIEGYLNNNDHLKAILLLVDIRHNPTKDDKTMMQYIKYFSIPYIIVATKADKISAPKRQKKLLDIGFHLMVDKKEILVTSTSNKMGKDELLYEIEKNL